MTKVWWGTFYTIKSALYGFNGNMHDWHIYPEFGGGMLYDWGVHLIDQMLWMIPGKLKNRLCGCPQCHQ